MADYIVSARKYRPSTFAMVVGQNALVQTLKNAVATRKLAHAYLFCGPRGVGKTTCARIFAKTINCQHLTPEGESCGECESCQAFEEQRSYNVYELDAASNNSVDNIRELIDQVRIQPQIGRYKVFIIDEVHMLSSAAFNAFLKTLEEPPAHAIFILCTTEKQKILPTILSRCQTFDFQRITVQDIAAQLQYIAGKEGIDAEPKALETIARKADGGMRDALSIFDQIASFTGGKITYEATLQNLNLLDSDTFFRLTDAALASDLPTALLTLDDVIRRGFDAQSFIGGWASHLRDLMMAQDASTLPLIEAGQEVAQQYQQQALRCSPGFLYAALRIAGECDFNYRTARNKRLHVEIAVVRICQLLAPPPPVNNPPVPPLRPTTPTQPSAAPYTPSAATSTATNTAVHSTANSTTNTAVKTADPAPPVVSGVPAPDTPAAPATKTTPVRGRRGQSLAGTMSSMPTLRRSQKTTTAPQAVHEPRNEPFDEEQLIRQYRAYITQHPEERLLTGAMHDSPIRLVDASHADIHTIGNQNLELIKQAQATLTAFLHEALHNDFLTLTFSNEDVETAHIAHTPREKLAEMQQEKPEVINEFLKTFNLELA